MPFVTAIVTAILRQDPDVVMVGEIRDREIAEIAMGAAVTGHLVVSTIGSTWGADAANFAQNSPFPPSRRRLCDPLPASFADIWDTIRTQ